MPTALFRGAIFWSRCDREGLIGLGLALTMIENMRFLVGRNSVNAKKTTKTAPKGGLSHYLSESFLNHAAHNTVMDFST